MGAGGRSGGASTADPVRPARVFAVGRRSAPALADDDLHLFDLGSIHEPREFVDRSARLPGAPARPPHTVHRDWCRPIGGASGRPTARPRGPSHQRARRLACWPVKKLAIMLVAAHRQRHVTLPPVSAPSTLTVESL